MIKNLADQYEEKMLLHESQYSKYSRKRSSLDDTNEGLDMIKRRQKSIQRIKNRESMASSNIGESYVNS